MAGLICVVVGVVRLRLRNRLSLALDLEVPALRGLGINAGLTAPWGYLRLRVNPRIPMSVVALWVPC